MDENIKNETVDEIINEIINKTTNETAAEPNPEETEPAAEYTDLSEEDSSSVPLNFDYYNKNNDDYSSLKKAALIAAISLCAIIAVAGGLRSLDQKKDEKVSVVESSHFDSYPGSPYADDNVITSRGTTENSLEYTVYQSHVRITGFGDVMMPIDLKVPATIEDKPVTEIDYYVFSYCQLRSLYIANPDCIFFENFDGFPPVPTEVVLAGKEGSEVQKIAEKYGNQFVVIK